MRIGAMTLFLLAAAMAASAFAQGNDRPLTAADVARALGETGSLTLGDTLFDAGTATLRPEAEAALAAIGDVLKNDQSLRVEIQGHTDTASNEAANLALSQARAAAVRDYLIKTFGIMPERLTAAGFGGTRPVADNATEAGRARNRRVDLVKMAAKTAAPQSSSTGAAPGQWTGRVTSGIMAIGGETTGIILSMADGSVELEAATPAVRQQLRQANGKTVTVYGSLSVRQGVEVRTRRIVRVEKVEAAAP